MDWFIEEPRRGQIALTVIALSVAILIIFLGRKKLLISVIVAFVFLIFAAAIIPSAVPSRLAAQRALCVMHLDEIRNAKQVWAREHAQSKDPPTPEALSKITGHPFPTCPKGGV